MPRRALVSRTHARGIVGEALSWAFDNVTLSFSLAANASAPSTAPPSAASAPRIVAVSAADYTPALSRRRGGAAAPLATEIYIPSSLGNFSVAVAGAASLAELVTWPDASRTAYVAPTGGVYSVSVSAAPFDAEARALHMLKRHSGAPLAHGPGEGEGDGSSGESAALAAMRERVLAALEARLENARSVARAAGFEF